MIRSRTTIKVRLPRKSDCKYWRIYDKKSGIYQIFQDPETKEWIGGFEKNEDWQSKEIENKLVKQIPNIIKNIK